MGLTFYIDASLESPKFRQCVCKSVNLFLSIHVVGSIDRTNEVIANQQLAVASGMRYMHRYGKIRLGIWLNTPKNC